MTVDIHYLGPAQASRGQHHSVAEELSLSAEDQGNMECWTQTLQTLSPESKVTLVDSFHLVILSVFDPHTIK